MLNLKKANRGKKIIIFSAIFIFAIAAFSVSRPQRAEAQSWFSGAATTGYRATISIGQVTLYDTSCKKVDATGVLNSINYFIPTKSALEWSAFLSVAPVLRITVGECGCAAGSVGGYSYGAISSGGSVGSSRAVANGTCSATINCSAGNVASVAPGEYVSACSAGWYDLNASCADGCESRCGNGVCDNGETMATCPQDCGCSPVGGTRTMYAALTNSCGTYVDSQVQTCQAVTYTYSPNNYTLTSPPAASTRTGYTASSVACGTSCVTQPQTCTATGWNGSGVGTCAPITCATAGICQSGGGCSAGNCVAVSNVAAGTDPYNQCAAAYNSCSGNNAIGPDGNCNGAGACNTGGLLTACATAGICQTGGGCSAGTCVAVSNAAAGTDPLNQCAAVYNSCSGNTKIGPDGNCNGAAACNTGGLSLACSGATPYCSGGNCVACLTAANCGTNGYTSYSCSSQVLQGYYRTWTCSGGNCSSASPLQTIQTCAWNYVCNASAGSCDLRTCPAGQYVYNATTYSLCSNCGNDTLYTSGVNSQTSCSSIPNDGYMTTGPVGARTGYTLCTAGYWCCSGGICAACSAGYYCPAGTGYVTAPSTALSNPCPAGSYCPAGASAPTTCPGGTYSSAGASSCTTCPANSYCPAGAPAPTACSGTMTSPAGSSSASQCVCTTASQCGTDGFIGNPTSCSGNNLIQPYVTYSCTAGVCGSSINWSAVKQTCPTITNSCQTGGGCWMNALANYECKAIGNEAVGVKCNGTVPHYVCDGAGNCTAPTHTVPMYYSGPNPASNCITYCQSEPPPAPSLYESCYTANVQCWESPSYVNHLINCSTNAYYTCNSAYLRCDCNYYLYN